MAPSVAAVPILLLLLLAAAAAAPMARWKPPQSPKNKKLEEWRLVVKFQEQFKTRKGKFSELADRISKRFAKGEKSVKDHPVLYRQPKGYQAPPSTFLQLNIEGEGTDLTQVHIRGDNLYIACFDNDIGEIFCFNDNQYNSYVIPGSYSLPFGASYADLVGDGRGGEAWKNLVGLKVSKNAVNRAVKAMSSHRRSKTTQTEIKELQSALATMAVFLCESTRFPYILGLVKIAFDGEGEDGELDHQAAQLVVQWKRISCALLIWNIDQKRWDGDEVNDLKVERPDGPGIADVEEALKSVGPILQTRDCSVEWYNYW